MPQRIQKILIVEDDPRMQQEATDAVSVLGVVETHCVQTLAEAKRLINQHVFDMAIIDLGLPDGSGISLIQQLSRRWPTLIPIARTVFDNDEQLFGALAAGAQGYLLKGQPQESLRAQLLAAAAGDPVISSSIARKVLRYFHNNVVFGGDEDGGSTRFQDAGVNPLTPREEDVLGLVGRGMTVAETASALQLSKNTVKTHVKSAYSKLNINSRAGAALEAQRLGLL